MEVCIKCGNLVADNELFCEKCGTPKAMIPQSTIQQVPQQNYQQYAQTKNVTINSNDSNMKIVKLIFEILGLLCGIVMLASLYMPVVNAEIGKHDETVTPMEAFGNVMNSIEDVMEDGIEQYSDSWFLFPMVSVLLPVFATVFAVSVCISKIIAIINIKKSNKLQIGGICTLLSVQLFYLACVGMLAITDRKTMGYLVRYNECKITMMWGWWFTTIVVIFTLLFGIIAGFIKNNEKKVVEGIDRFIAPIIGGVSAILSFILCIFASIPVFEIENTTISNCTILGLLYNFGNYIYEEIYKMDEVVEALAPCVYIIVTVLALLAVNIAGFRNSVIAVAKSRYKYISGMVISIINIIAMIFIQVWAGSISDSKLFRRVDVDVESIVNSYIVIAVILLVLNIAYMVIKISIGNYNREGYNSGTIK